jgi:hypothetical protein
VPTGGLQIDALGGAEDTLTVIGSPAADAVTFDAGSVSVGSASFSTAGFERATFDGNGGWDVLIIAGGPTVSLARGQALASLSLNGSGSARATDGGAALLTRALYMAPGTALDLAGGALALNYTGDSPIGSWDGSAYTGLAGLIASSRNGGGWDGAGILSSRARGSNDYTTLALGEAGDVLSLSGHQTANWNGQTVDSSTVLVKYTYGGDANLDGQINIDDYSNIDSSAAVGGQLKGWFNGDFNYDGEINIDDYSIIDGNIGIQGAPL